MKKAILWWVLCAVLLPGLAFADGFALYGLGGEGLIRADAISASVKDASSVWYNPGAVANLKGTNAEFSPNVLWAFVEHNSSLTGEKTKSQANPFFIPAFYVTTDLGMEKLGLGLAVNAPYGLGLTYPHSADYAASVSRAELKSMQFAPTVSYKVLDNLSFGIQANVYRVTASLETTMGYVADSQQIVFTANGDGNAFGFTTGVSYKPAEKHSVGLVYRSQVVVKLDGGNLITDVQDPAGMYGFAPPGTPVIIQTKADTETSLRFPDAFVAAYAFEPNEKCLYEIDFIWRNWNDVGTIRLVDPTTNVTQSESVQNWNNGFEIALSGVRKFTDTLSLKAGYLYSHSPVIEDTFNMLVPDLNFHMITLGPSMRFTEDLEVNLPLAYAFAKTRELGKSPNAPGTLKFSAARIGLTASYKFGGE